MTLSRTCVAGVIAAAGCAAAAWGWPEVPYASIPGSATHINFDSMVGSPTLGAGEVLGGQYASQGVSFTTPNFNAYATNGAIATLCTINSDPNMVWADQGGGGGGASAVGLHATFSSPVSIVGAVYAGSSTGTFSLAVYSGTTLLETVTKAFGPGGPGQQGTIAIQRTEPITRAVMYATNSSGVNWNFSIDDLRFQGAGTDPCTCIDYNGDTEIDFTDIEGFLARYVATSGNLDDCAPLGADQNGDDEIDFTDIEVFIAKYNSCT